jgi:hypothetical protein
MDPIGFAFEHFDGDGRWRLMDGASTIDDSGEIIGSRSTNGTFTGTFDLASHLAASAEVQQCWATMWATYGTGYRDSFAAACETASKITPNSNLLAARRALTETTPFQQRKGGLGELDAPLTNASERVDDDATIDPKIDAIVKYQQGSPWPAGACYDGSVTNLSQQDVDWEVTTEVTAHINNVWNCQYIINGTKVTFTGEQWNRTVTPGSTVTFGFCVDF